MNLVLQGGTVLLSDGTTAVADVTCADGRIAAIGAPGTGSADEVVDCRGLHVLPGVIDPHVHTRDPGALHKEDLEHASAAAAAGGVTTIFEMPNTVPPVTDPDVLAERAIEHQRRSLIDTRLWALVLGGETEDHLVSLVGAGAVAGKLFWGYAFDRQTGALVYDPSTLPADRLLQPATNGEVRSLFRAAGKAGLLLGLHCEDRTILDAAAGPVQDYDDLLTTRPVEAETVSIASAIELAATTGARIHVLHVSSARGIELIRRAKGDGVQVTAETCPHYLSLTPEDYATAGSALKIFPPVRSEIDRRALITAVEDGTVDSIGSDHAPHSLEERSGPFGAQPAGAVAVETMVAVVLDRVAAGELSLSAAVEAMSARTASLYGLGRQKGRLEVGYDADATLVDLEASWEVDAAQLHSKARISPWHGRHLTGRPRATVVGGRVVMRDGEVEPRN
jgi:dihydroorotase